jgi:peptidylprolyl isomerase
MFYPKTLFGLLLFTGSLLFAEEAPNEPEPKVLQPALGIKATILKAGSGSAVPQRGQVKVHYKGWLPDGVEFASSYDKDQALEFSLGIGQVIKGWDLGIPGMQRGEVRKLVLQPEMGYGNRKTGPIPANAVLVYEVELVDFVEALKPDVIPDLSKFQWQVPVSGVEVFDEKIGSGIAARPGTEVSVHYSGWLAGGSPFGSSKDEGKPLNFVLGGGKVLRGWEHGVQGMAPGGVRWLRLQPYMAYGERDLPRIPAHSVLLFRVEMLEIDDKPEGSESQDIFPAIADLDWKNGPEGLKYYVIRKGEGPSAQAGQSAMVHYTGWLATGEKFDSSRDRGEPFSFPLGQKQVIRGWDLGVEGMNPGEKRMLMIPPKLGYGDRQAGPIPPGSVLIFAVEYLGEQ